MPDARKSLDQLRKEWSSCTRCELGVQRHNNQGKFVPGQGSPRSLMFIGEGPGVDDEDTGVPFMGTNGDLLRSVLQRMGVQHFYLSNLVACRSCEPVLDENNMPRFRGGGRGPAIPMLRDIPPNPVMWKACLPRLQEEIYIVDPVIIISLGNTAAEGLTGGHITITRDRGQTVTIDVPGAGRVAQLTEKKQVWYRKVNGVVVAPTEQAMVQYTLIPTFHPAYVRRKIADQGHNSPFRLFVEDIRKAVKIYEMYVQEIHHQPPTGASNASYEEVSNYYFGEGDK